MLPFLANAALYVIPFLVVITFIVTIHELGHFLTARACGVAVDRFSIGFGRAIFSFKDKWGVEWRIGWLPLGGYVRFSGDENIASVPDQADLSELRTHIALREGVGAEKKYFFFKPLWQRALVVAAGPVANFILSIALFAILFGTMGENAPSLQVQSVVGGSAAASAGLLPGDVITAVDGQAMDRFDDFQTYIQQSAQTPVRLSVLRAGHTLDVMATPAVKFEPNPAGGVTRIGMLGVQPTEAHLDYQPLAAVGRGAQMTWSVVAKTGYFVNRMIQGKAEWPFSGILGTAHVTGAMTKEAVDISNTEHISLALTLAIQFTTLAALLSTSIGLVNLLPIPVLDGGHLLFYAYEAVARRPLPASAQAAGYRVGLALLVGLMLFTTWHDLQRMQVFHFFGHLFS
ncbi:MAG TPA: M50 family metallopeptidase [Caulobacteraceae bacterium]|jgi:regulator of sigma E protease|nr:M50 family metallopeptidase [Caulobacteraceae bacterium]